MIIAVSIIYHNLEWILPSCKKKNSCPTEPLLIQWSNPAGLPPRHICNALNESDEQTANEKITH